MTFLIFNNFSLSMIPSNKSNYDSVKSIKKLW